MSPSGLILDLQSQYFENFSHVDDQKWSALCLIKTLELIGMRKSNYIKQCIKRKVHKGNYICSAFILESHVLYSQVLWTCRHQGWATGSWLVTWSEVCNKSLHGMAELKGIYTTETFYKKPGIDLNIRQLHYSLLYSLIIQYPLPLTNGECLVIFFSPN